jgi:hypothetical protein
MLNFFPQEFCREIFIRSYFPETLYVHTFIDAAQMEKNIAKGTFM